jgi:hypothetical protein
MQKRYCEAQALRKTEVEGWERVQGANHVTTLNAFMWWARAVYDQNMFKESEVLWREVVRRWIRATGNWHPSTLDAMSWLALAVSAQKHHKEAQRLWETILSWRLAYLEDLHSTILKTLRPAVLSYSGDGDSGVVTPGSSITQDVGAATLVHSDLITLRDLDAAAPRYLDATALAELDAANLRDSKTIARGDSDPVILNAKSRLAQTLHEWGLYAKAELLWKELIKLRQELQGGDHKDTVYTMQWLTRTQQAMVYEAQRQVTCYYRSNWGLSSRGTPLLALGLRDDRVSATSTWFRQRQGWNLGSTRGLTIDLSWISLQNTKQWSREATKWGKQG